MKKNRQTGYFWVKLSEGWVVGLYYEPGDIWFLIESYGEYEENEFEEIDENQIVRQ